MYQTQWCSNLEALLTEPKNQQAVKIHEPKIPQAVKIHAQKKAAKSSLKLSSAEWQAWALLLE